MKNKNLLVALSALVLCFVAALFIFLAYIINQQTQQQRNDVAILKNLSLISLRQVVNDEFGNKQPVIDAGAKRLYLPGLNLYLPLSLDSLDVNYRVTDANGGGTTDLMFSSKQNNNSYSALRDSSNECLDLVRAEIGATISQPRPGETAQPPFKLADGRSVYLYLPKADPACREFQLVPPSTVLDSVKQLHSY